MRPDPDDEPTVSVVICAFTVERWASLQAAVASVAAQPANPEIIVVIDHCDELLAMAKANLTGLAGATVVASTEPAGLSGARNTGVRHATGAVVAFLDDDATAVEGWLETLISQYADPAVLGVGGAALPAWTGAEPAWLPREFRWVVGCSYEGLPRAAETVRNFIGANMSYRSAVFDKVGGFTHSLGRTASRPLGCEETELGIRARRAFPGSRFVYDPAAQVLHSVGPDRTTWSYFRRRCWAEGQSKAVLARIGGAGDALESERRYVLRVLPRAVVTGLLSPLRGGWQRAAAVIAGLAITSAGYGWSRLTLR